MTSRLEWATHLMIAGRFAQTPAHCLGLVAWSVAEGSNAAWNPLDTTERAPGSTDYNSAGVQNYPDEPTGIEATLATLANGDYAAVLTELRSSPGDALALARAVGASPWGTGDFSAVVKRVAADASTYYGQQVAGSSPPGQEDEVYYGADGADEAAQIADARRATIRGWWLTHRQDQELSVSQQDQALAYWEAHGGDLTLAAIRDGNQGF